MNENQSPVSLPIMKVRYDVVVYINCCFEFVIMSCIQRMVERFTSFESILFGVKIVER